MAVFDVTDGVFQPYANLRTNSSGAWTLEGAWIGDHYVISYYKAGYVFGVNDIRITAVSGGITVETVTAERLQIDGLVCNEADYTYTTDTVAETATITGYTGTDAVIQLPETLGGYPVTAISSNAFSDNVTLETVVFSGAVSSIDSYAFSGCNNLKQLYLPGVLTQINAGAFQYCTALENVELPDSISYIGYRAFRDCTKLSSINYPLGLTNTDSEIFRGCRSLKRITVPEGATIIPDNAFDSADYLEEVILPETVTVIGGYAFSACVAMKSIDLPEGLTQIKEGAFNNCTALKSIRLPEKLTAIEANTFQYCSALESMELPDSVSYIGYRAFRGCTKLSSINYPLSLTNTDSEIFRGCSSLKSIEVPEGVTSLPASVFNNATDLRTVSLPETLTSIGAYAFYNCDSLRVMEVPKGVNSIGERAFAECDSLRLLFVENGNSAMGYNILQNSPEVTLYCAYLSFATLYAIDNNIPFAQTGYAEDNVNLVLDYENSSYYGDLNAVAANGTLTMTLDYGLKENIGAAVSNMSLYLMLPVNCDLNEETLKLNNILCTNYSYDGDRVLEIPVSENSGTLKFTLSVKSQGKLYSYATLRCDVDGEQNKEIIGILNDQANVLTIHAPEITPNSSVAVNGLAPASSEVTLYVNGEEQKTIGVSKAGNWNGIVTLPSPVDYHSYTITAVCTFDGSTMEQKAKVMYRENEATITDFVMHYNEHNVIMTCDLLNMGNIKPKVYFVPGTQFDFEVKFDHPEQINTIYITSTRNNETKYLEAVYDENKGAFITNGFFDESDAHYVPGVLSIEYTKKVPTVSVGDTYDWSLFDGQISGRTENTVVFKELTETDCKAQIDLGSMYGSLQDVFMDATISVYDEATDGNLGDWLGVFEDLDTLSSYIVPGEDGKNYLVTMDYSDPYSYVMLVRDVSGSKFVKVVLDTAIDTTENLDTVWTLTQISSTISTTNTIAGILLKQHEIETEMDALREEVWSSSYATPEQRAEALRRVDALEKDQSYFALITTVLPLIVAAAPLAMGATMAAPAIAFTALLGVFTAVAPIFWQMRTAQIKTGKFRVDFVIDPSGYVYDASTMERIRNVQTTAYYIPYDDSEGFWDTKPTADVYGEIWDASEYNQSNPLYTNADGKYAWDVPEGWWRVKYEKFGYETTWSEWLPVPPPQTDVNIGMTPRDDCGCCGDDVIWTLDDEGLLTISGTGAMYDFTAEKPARWSGTAVKQVVIEENVTSVGSFAFFGCSNLSVVTFKDEAPEIGANAFMGVTATVNYPQGLDSWTEEVMRQYGGTITWTPVGHPDGWAMENDLWYYYVGGKTVTGWQLIGNVWYFFNTKGIMQTGWLQSGSIWYYLRPNGAMAIGWELVGGKYYYFNSSGVMQTGWQKINGQYYCLHASGAMMTGWLLDSGVWYYLKSSGAMAVGWQVVGGKYYFFGASGAMLTGWLLDGGVWYYLKSSGAMATGWEYINGKYYYFKTNGAMARGWVQDGGVWYYMQPSGAMHTGWLQQGSTWYYLKPNGAMACGETLTIGGKRYSFGANGVWIS